MRFEFLEARDGSKVSAAGPPFITVMGIVDDGCHVQLGDYLPEPNRTYEFESDEGWDVTGFYFRTGDDPDMDPVVFMLEGSETCNGDWKVIGGSRRYLHAGCARLVMFAVLFGTRQKRPSLTRGSYLQIRDGGWGPVVARAAVCNA